VSANDLELLPGVTLTPRMLLADIAAKNPTKVIVCTCDESEHWRASWSEMTVADLVLAYRWLGMLIDRKLEDPDLGKPSPKDAA
jgi:hypothetical protein